MNDLTTIEKILIDVKSKIESHNEFKSEYDRQLAFDFSLFNFFDPGENKISEILAYFLDEKQNHGQGNAFLFEFVKLFGNDKIDITHSLNVCEKSITNNRRIDIYIKLQNFTIAIENKIWASDQDNQLKDYAKYLEKQSKENFLLFYLTPYGTHPSAKSIDKEYKAELIKNGQLRVLSYKHDITNLLNKWLVVCEAESVSHFIKEFKKYLEIKFLGNNKLNMSKNLREIIYENQTEVESLVSVYKKIENEVTDKLNVLGKALEKENPHIDTGIEIGKSGLFNWEGSRVYKFSVSKGVNKVWIQFVKHEIDLFSNHYFQEGTEIEFKELVKNSGINDNLKINYLQSNEELVKLFLKQVEIAKNTLIEYDKIIASH